MYIYITLYIYISREREREKELERGRNFNKGERENEGGGGAYRKIKNVIGEMKNVFENITGFTSDDLPWIVNGSLH